MVLKVDHPGLKTIVSFIEKPMLTSVRRSFNKKWTVSTDYLKIGIFI